MMQLENMIRKVIEDECEDYFFGVANLSSAKKLILGQKESLIAEYPKAISIGVTMPPTLQSASLGKYKSSKVNYYDKTIQQLNHITVRLSNLLQIKGYKALPIPVESESDDQRTFSAFSHELIANLAGLGYIGKNGLLITPEVGSKVLWSTLLTDAPLKATGKPLKGYNGLNKFKITYNSMDE